MDKILWVDTETTGLSEWKNAVIQISGYVTINGNDEETFDFMVRPFPQDEVHHKALEVNKRTRKEIETFPEPNTVYNHLVCMLDRYIDKFNPDDKFTLAGYNVGFDKKFLASFFKKNGNNFFHSYVDYHILDVMSAVQIYKASKKPNLPNYKLITIAKHFGFDVNFHNALDDIRVTRMVYERVMLELGG